MDLSNLKPAEGATKNEKKRLGRGQGTGKGGTSTQGHKGQKARSGYSQKVGFEGGQMPLHRTSPKFGFKNINRKEYKAINLEVIQMLADKEGLTAINSEILYKAGLIAKSDLVKILGKGTLSSPVEVKAHAFSKSAVAAIEAANGTAIKI
jgi:large subunit ribosomal protein L15